MNSDALYYKISLWKKREEIRKLVEDVLYDAVTYSMIDINDVDEVVKCVQAEQDRYKEQLEKEISRDPAWMIFELHDLCERVKDLEVEKSTC